MSERTPRPSSGVAVGEPDVWAPDRLAAALGRPPEPAADVAFGPGLRFRLGRVHPVDLELFPASGVVRLTGGDLQLALFRQHAGPRLEPEGLVFALTEPPVGRSLVVSPAGEVTLFLAAPDDPDPPQRPQAALRTADRPDVLPDAATPLAGDPGPSDGVPDRPPEPGLPDPERQERVRLAGRLGADVRVRQTRTGRLVASFPLAVPHDDGSTRWEAVVAFDDRARALKGQDGPTKGRYVEVIGYRHQRQETGKDGRTRTIQEIYAVVVKPR